MKNTVHISLILLLFVSSALPAAEKTDKAARRAAILMQKMKQDLEAEKSAMQTQFEQDKQGLSQALNQAQAEQRTNSTKLQNQVRHNQQLQIDNQKLSNEKAAMATQLQQLKVQLTEQAQQLAIAAQQLNHAQMNLEINDQQHKRMEDKFNATHQQLSTCEEKNTRLYALGQELVSLYDDASAYTKAMRAESFFQLKRTELENILQAKHDEILESKFVQSTP